MIGKKLSAEHRISLSKGRAHNRYWLGKKRPYIAKYGKDDPWYIDGKFESKYPKDWTDTLKRSIREHRSNFRKKLRRPIESFRICTNVHKRDL